MQKADGVQATENINKKIKAEENIPVAPEVVIIPTEPLPIKIAPIAPVEVTEVSSDALSDKMFIYNNESGNDPTKWNGSGCVGLGQACPASKLLAVCPNLDYACEDNWFSNVYLARYQNSWANARAFWEANHWW